MIVIIIIIIIIICVTIDYCSYAAAGGTPSPPGPPTDPRRAFVSAPAPLPQRRAGDTVGDGGRGGRPEHCSRDPDPETSSIGK